jgi:hypothetical protein
MAATFIPVVIACDSGLASARPDPKLAGLLYYATDTNILSRDTGSAWETVTLDAAMIASGQIRLGADALTSVDTPTAAILAAANTFTVAPQQITIDAAGHTGLVVKAKASQTADLQRWTSSADAVLSRINKAGYLVTALHAAPADGDLAAGECAIWFDQTDGAGKLMIKAKTADGTVATGSVTLT